jgi:hypothetical protein
MFWVAFVLGCFGLGQRSVKMLTSFAEAAIEEGVIGAIGPHAEQRSPIGNRSFAATVLALL